jgi:hypothetical protein
MDPSFARCNVLLASQPFPHIQRPSAIGGGPCKPTVCTRHIGDESQDTLDVRSSCGWLLCPLQCFTRRLLHPKRNHMQAMVVPSGAFSRFVGIVALGVLALKLLPHAPNPPIFLSVTFNFGLS